MAADWIFWLRKNVMAYCIKWLDYWIELNSPGDDFLSDIPNVQLELAGENILA